MRIKTSGELSEEARRLKTQMWLRRAGYFAFSLLFTFVFIVVTRSAALNIADDMATDGKSAEQVMADNDMPFMVTRPPDGGGWLLTRANLRWLVREEIRLEAMRSVVNFENDRALKEYIAMLREFNAIAENCSCEAEDWRAARADIERFRAVIEENARLEAEVNGWDKW